MHDWSDRAQWTQEQRTPYADSTPDYHRRVSELASPEELAEIVAELGHHYQDLGRQLRVAKRSAPLLDQQKGETRAACQVLVGQLGQARSTMAEFIKQNPG
jgi:hypothetical protein